MKEHDHTLCTIEHSTGIYPEPHCANHYCQLPVDSGEPKPTAPCHSAVVVSGYSSASAAHTLEADPRTRFKTLIRIANSRPCPPCGHNGYVAPDGLCTASIPLIDIEPHGSKPCRCPCVNFAIDELDQNPSTSSDTEGADDADYFAEAITAGAIDAGQGYDVITLTVYRDVYERATRRRGSSTQPASARNGDAVDQVESSVRHETEAIEAMLDRVQPDYPNLTRDELRDLFHATYEQLVRAESTPIPDGAVVEEIGNAAWKLCKDEGELNAFMAQVAAIISKHCYKPAPEKDDQN